MSSVPSVFASSVRKIADAVAVRADTCSLLKTMDLDHAMIDDPALRIPYSDMMLLIEHAARVTRDQAFGPHVGERVPLRSYGIVGDAIMTSSTVAEALCSQVRYLPITRWKRRMLSDTPNRARSTILSKNGLEFHRARFVVWPTEKRHPDALPPHFGCRLFCIDLFSSPPQSLQS